MPQHEAEVTYNVLGWDTSGWCPHLGLAGVTRGQKHLEALGKQQMEQEKEPWRVRRFQPSSAQPWSPRTGARNSSRAGIHLDPNYNLCSLNELLSVPSAELRAQLWE